MNFGRYADFSKYATLFSSTLKATAIGIYPFPGGDFLLYKLSLLEVIVRWSMTYCFTFSII